MSNACLRYDRDQRTVIARHVIVLDTQSPELLGGRRLGAAQPIVYATAWRASGHALYISSQQQQYRNTSSVSTKEHR